MADFVHGVPPALAFEEQACHRDDEAGSFPDIAVSVDDAARDVDAGWRLFASIDEPAFGRTGRTRTIIPEINGKV